MDKANVMKALYICGGIGCVDCKECPYYGVENCDNCMNNDAIALLKSEPEHNSKPTYDQAVIYTKRDNLLKWFNVNDSFWAIGTDARQRMKAVYATEREIQLILLVRRENGKTICRIKCPINPLPIKGEFQCVSTSEMTKLLASMGWKYKEKIHSAMFR